MASTINAKTTGVGGIDASGDASGVLALQTGGTTALTIDASQNVGIGTSSPSKKLSINGDFRLGDGGGTGAIFTDATVGLRFMLPAAGTSNTESMRIDSSGNVGIGTSSPGARLDVRTTSSTQATFTRTGQTAVCTLYQSTADTYLSATNSGANLILATQDTERMRLDSSGNLLFNSGYGSVATAYGCRAWVNFNGTGTVAIRASGNVSSITDNGTGDYTVNFTTAMPDANYSTVGSNGSGTAGNDEFTLTTNYNAAPTTSATRVGSNRANSGAATDVAWISVAIFR